jgi:hypothetical protein
LKNKILVFLILLLLPITIHALEETTLLYEENPTKYKALSNVIIDDDKNVVTVGFEIDEANNSYKSIISKYKLDGTLIWEKDFLTTDSENRPFGITSAGDGYIVVGGAHVKTSETDTDTDYDMYIYKIGKDGSTVWHKEESKTGSDLLISIKPVQDGFIAVGYTTSEYFVPSEGYVDKNAYIRKINNEGETVWEHTIEGNGIDIYYHVAIDGDGIIAAGETSSTNLGLNIAGASDFLVTKYNADGTIVGSIAVGDAGEEEIHYVFVEEDGYILVGESNSPQSEPSLGKYLVALKINKNSETQGIKTYSLKDDEAWSLIPYENGYYIVGHSLTDEANQKYQGFVLDIDKQGINEKFTKYNKNAPTLFRAATATDDGFVVVGFTRVTGASDVYAAPLMVKYTKGGSETPGDDSHGAVDPTTEEPTTEPETKPQPQEDNPKTGAFLTSGLVILVLIGLLIYNIRKKDTFNI